MGTTGTFRADLQKQQLDPLLKHLYEKYSCHISELSLKVAHNKFQTFYIEEVGERGWNDANGDYQHRPQVQRHSRTITLAYRQPGRGKLVQKHLPNLRRTLPPRG